MSLSRISHPCNSTEDTSEFTGIPPNVLLMSYIDRFKHEIESLKETIINQLQDKTNKRGFSSTDHNTKTIIHEMASQTK